RPLRGQRGDRPEAPPRRVRRRRGPRLVDRPDGGDGGVVVPDRQAGAGLRGRPPAPRPVPVAAVAPPALTDAAAPAAPPDACPVGAAGAPAVYLDGEERRLTAAALGPSRTDVSPGRVLRCRVCGLGYRQRRPDAAHLAGLYRALDDGVYESDRRGR